MRLFTIALAGIVSFVFPGNGLAAETGAPSDWMEVAAGPMFTVRAPPGTSFERIRTGDAFAGAFHGPGFDLSVEFGYHRDGMKLPEGAKNAMETKLLIDEKPGAITKAAASDPAHPYFIGLYVPDVEKDLLGPLSLVVTGATANTEGEATVERIYETVKFGYKN